MLSESLLSKQDTICLLELIHQSLSCSKEEGFRRIINKLCNLISSDFAVCASGKIDNSGNIESYNIINVSYPSEWLDLYTSKRYYQIDPIIRKHITNFKLHFWADAYEVRNLPKELIGLTEDFELRRGYTHGMRNPKGQEGSLFLSQATPLSITLAQMLY